MRHKEIVMLLGYILNTRNRLESEKKQLQANIRYRAIDETDCLELLIASVRLETFIETTNAIRTLLNLFDEEEGE